MPAAARPAPSCITQPGFPVATTCGRAALSEASLGASTARDIAGSTSANNPALPQHCSRSEEHTSELQSRLHVVCRLLLEKKKIMTLALVVRSRCQARKAT